MSNDLAPANQAPAFRFGERREILISTGYGTGWSTYNSRMTREMLYDADIIAHLKAGGEMTDTRGRELVQKYEDAGMNTLGADNLTVVVATTPFRVTEYDGNEGVEEFTPESWEF